jgi:hypothetical protein
LGATNRPQLTSRRGRNEESLALAREWRRLGRAATFVAVLTSPMLFVVLYQTAGWSVLGALAGAFGGIVLFRARGARGPPAQAARGARGRGGKGQ